MSPNRHCRRQALGITVRGTATMEERFMMNLEEPVADAGDGRGGDDRGGDGGDGGSGSRMAHGSDLALRSRLQRLQAQWRDRRAQAQAEWDAVSALPGTRLWLRSCWLSTDDGTALGHAERRGERLEARLRLERLGLDGRGRLKTVHIAGRAYQTRYGKHPRFRNRAALHVVDTHGGSALSVTGRHFNGSSGSRVRLTSSETLSFPVSGTRPADAVMRAVGDGGRVLMVLRRCPASGSRTGVEVVVNPDVDLTDELLLVVFVAAPFLRSFFDTPGGG
jgi:hypothetical protein